MQSHGHLLQYSQVHAVTRSFARSHTVICTRSDTVISLRTTKLGLSGSEGGASGASAPSADEPGEGGAESAGARK